MKTLRTIIAVVLIIMLAFSLTPTSVLSNASASMFSDVTNHWAQKEIEELAAKGIISGMGDGRYAPNDPVTREQFLKLVIAVCDELPNAETDLFYDVPTDRWSNPYVAEGLDRGIFTLNEAEDHLFDPIAPMDRDTVALWITRALGIDGTSESTPFTDSSMIVNKTAVSVAVFEGLLSGYPDLTFRPANTLTRAEAAVIIKRLLDKDLELNAPVVERNNIVLQDGVLKLEPAIGANVLTSVDEETGRYVFDNIDDNLRSLQQGQIFVIYPCSSVPEGIAIKVKDTVINGTSAEIWTADLELSEIFETFDVGGTTDISLANIKPDPNLPEGMTLTNLSAQTNEKAKIERYSADLQRNSVPTGVPRSSGFGVKMADVKLPNSNIELSGEIWLDVKVVHDVDYPKKIEVYTQNKLTINVEASVGAKIGAGSSAFLNDKNLNGGNLIEHYREQGDRYKEVKQAIGEISVPLGATGLSVYGSILLSISAEGKITAKVEYEDTFKTGIRIKNGSPTTINDHEKKFGFSLDMDGTIKMGPDIEVGIQLLNGFLKAGLTVKAGLGIKASASLLELSNIFGDHSGAELGFGGYSATLEDGRVKELHGCLICADGDIYLYLELDFEISINVLKTKVTIAEAKLELANEKNAKFLDFYISLRPNFDISTLSYLVTGPLIFEFNLGECPYIYKAPSIIKQPVNQVVAAGKDVSLSIDARNESNEVKQDKYKPANYGLSYEWYKDGVSVTGGSNSGGGRDGSESSGGVSSSGGGRDAGSNFMIPSVREEDSGSYYCVVYLTEHPMVAVQSKTVTLIVLAPDPDQIDADLSEKPVETDPGESKGGEFEIIVPDF